MAPTSSHHYTSASNQTTPPSPPHEVDPMAVSRASWSSVSSPEPKQNGPLIDYNRRPDSYFVVPTRTEHIRVFPASTKNRIITTRWIQFALRILQLVVALGLLICVICLRGVNDVESWILRLPPAWDACIASYAILHLFRPARARTPLSSASYHTFSFFMDVGLIPFLAVDAFFAENNWSMSAGEDGRWRSFFTATGATDILLFVTWVLAMALGGLHLISAMIDLYLIIIFRKIAKYPADSNPLESNLTSRAASKHKYKDSNLIISEKSLPNMSCDSLASNMPTSNNMSNTKLVPETNVRPMCYHQSRSGTLYQQPYSATTSRNGMDEQAPSYRSSLRAESRPRSRSRPRTQGSRPGSLSRLDRSSYQSEHDPMPTSPHNFLSAGDRPGHYHIPLMAPQASIPASVAKLQQNDSLLNDNWCVVGEDEQGDISTARRTPIDQTPWARDLDDDSVDVLQPRSPTATQLSLHAEDEENILPLPLKPKASPSSSSAPSKSPLSYSEVHSELAKMHDTDEDADDNASIKTTSTVKDHGAFYFSDMAPGSLQLDVYGDHHPGDEDLSNETSSAHDSEGTIGRAYTITAGTSTSSSLFTQDKTSNHSRSSSPRRKVYGGLSSAQESSRDSSLSANNTLTVPSKPRGGRSRSQEPKAPPTPQHRTGQSGRVISRTGVDLDDANIMYIDPPLGASGIRSRQVSGKVAEEGLAGAKSVWWGGKDSAATVKVRELSGAA